MAIDTEKIYQSPRESTIGKVLGKILTWIIVLIAALIFIADMWNVVDRMTDYNAPIFGYRFSVIVSDSMSVVNSSNKEELEGITDQFDKSDVVVTRSSISYADIDIHDIVLVDYDGTLVCHRVIDKYISDDGAEMIRTRGDANSTPDIPVSFSQIKGIVIDIIPDIGIVTLFLQSPYGLLGVSLAIFFICLGCLIGSKYSDNRRNFKGYTVSAEPGVLSISPLYIEMGEHPERRKDLEDKQVL